MFKATSRAILGASSNTRRLSTIISLSILSLFAVVHSDAQEMSLGGSLNAPYMPGYMPPLGYFEASAMSMMPAIAPPPQPKSLPAGFGIASTLLQVAQVCVHSRNQMPVLNFASLESAASLQDAADSYNDEAGNLYDPNINENYQRAIGAQVDATFGIGCENFIDKEGRVGPWGRAALEEIRRNQEAFGQNVPGDIHRYCRNFAQFDEEKRNMYWLWTMMSMAASESSCRPGANNPNAPNGTAFGLFQLEERVCGNLDLSNPFANTRCAARRLANELNCRTNLMTPTSRGPCGTYWGPLRSDDQNRARGGDISGAQKTRCLMRQFPDCGNGPLNDCGGA